MIKLVAISPEKIAEVRNCLTIISGNAQILRGTLEISLEETLEFLDEIINQVDRIDEILPQVKFEKGA